jgi:hypothetical protein
VDRSQRDPTSRALRIGPDRRLAGLRCETIDEGSGGPGCRDSSCVPPELRGEDELHGMNEELLC